MIQYRPTKENRTICLFGAAIISVQNLMIMGRNYFQFKHKLNIYKFIFRYADKCVTELSRDNLDILVET